MPGPLLLLGGAAAAMGLPFAVGDSLGLAEDLGYDPLGRRRRATSEMEDVLGALLGEEQGMGLEMAEQRRINRALRDSDVGQYASSAAGDVRGAYERSELADLLGMRQQQELAEMAVRQDKTRTLDDVLTTVMMQGA